MYIIETKDIQGGGKPAVCVHLCYTCTAFRIKFLTIIVKIWDH